MSDEPDKRAYEKAVQNARQGFLETQLKLFDKAAAYTNLILLGGYAGAFTIWNYTRAQLAPKTNIIVALLLGASLTAFIVFEVYKMISVSFLFHRTGRLLDAAKSDDDFIAGLDQHRSKLDRDAARIMPVWAVVQAICVPAAVLAIALLFYNYFAILFGLPLWPT